MSLFLGRFYENKKNIYNEFKCYFKKRCCVTSDIVRTDIESEKLKVVLVKKNPFKYVDLKTSEKYNLRVSCYSNVGDKFVTPENKISFNEFSNNNHRLLSKKKVLKIYNSMKDEK